ncbi:MAG TPA: cyclic pyranopterin monophosphate synthase MoaC [Deltaproteobacteria bacterium]|nr:MAG: cyclic pyranopterin monophosphate synthase MoaC [Deltaproteobacteria bacterium]RLB05700.1 MAG: cyclic pyranopterin monophosphate synthase MoaC [Deltaproteobacteria bacterium]HDM77125.1 cyclic pyranopterin monophosphate synthase MoaC [Deltaproteobacteria bacterium]
MDKKQLELVLSHLDAAGRVKMVDVSEKDKTWRQATAKGSIKMQKRTMELILTGKTKKGNVLETARIAGIMAAKKTSDLIPLCHPIQLSKVELYFNPDEAGKTIEIEATVKAFDRTGVEMEALMAVASAALTIYDMCKAVDREMTINDIRLVYKSGGRSGVFEREGEKKTNSELRL